MGHEIWIFIAVWCLTLIIPLAYAIGTLLGMQSKTFIPLLRTRGADGNSHTIMRSIHSPVHSPIQRRVLWLLSAT